MAQEVILCIGDLHFPHQHPDSLIFIEAVTDLFKPTKFVLLGDEVDNHCISFHDTSPDIAYSPSTELEAAIEKMKHLYDIIGKDAVVLESNHSSLVYRRQRHEGLPRSVFRDWSDILEAPSGWRWTLEYFHELPDGRTIYFHHGKSKAIMKTGKTVGCCSVQAHFHSCMSVNYWNCGHQTLWQAQVGCLTDEKHLAMDYGKNFLDKGVLGCLVVVDGTPIIIPMTVDSNNRWNRSI